MTQHPHFSSSTRVALTCLFALTALTVLTVGTASAASSSTSPALCTVQSPAHRVALVELYTSQGCSSCPPADRWLSGFSQRYRATQAIPLALHVGYWDYIGWKDPFAKREFNERQRQWATANQNNTVYTPSVFVHGRELRDWAGEPQVSRRIKAINDSLAAARIELGAHINGAQLRVDVHAQALNAAANSNLAAGGELRVALTQNGLRTAVKAGENRGESLGNDHVVREWSAALPLGKHQLKFDLPSGTQPRDWAVVAFVQSGPGKDVLQAVQWTAAACSASGGG
jgi:hypothetical protein